MCIYIYTHTYFRLIQLLFFQCGKSKNTAFNKNIKCYILKNRTQMSFNYQFSCLDNYFYDFCINFVKINVPYKVNDVYIL